jgi:signal peptidase I
MTNDTQTRFYRGNSMGNIFHPGDRLRVIPIADGEIIPGDVIVFHKTHRLIPVLSKNGESTQPKSGSSIPQPNAGQALEQAEDVVVHRVIEIVETGVITRGDNNRHRDLVPVQWEQIFGKVETVESKGRGKPVTGGIFGLWRAKLHWAVLDLDYWVRRCFRQPYHILRRSRFAARLWQPTIHKIRLQTQNGAVVKYIYKQRTVAIWETRQQSFECHKPFDLVIPHPRNSKEDASLD